MLFHSPRSTARSGKNFLVAKHYKKEVKSMRKLLLLVAIIATFVSPSAALATNGHQDHRGACARSTTTISKGVSDLKYNGVAVKFARAMGIRSYDGSVTKQLKNRLTVATVVSATRTRNKGCNGNGGTIGAGKRTLYKGEKVIVKVPAKYGKDVCVHTRKGCRAVTITVNVALPSSCWNLNRGKIRVKIWVKTHKQPSTKKKTPKKKTPKKVAEGCSVAGQITVNGNCVSQDNQNKTVCTNSTCPTVQVNNNCGNVAVNTGTNVTVNNTQGENCNTQWEECVNKGGSWNSTINVCTYPPVCTQNCVPPPPVDHAPWISCTSPAHMMLTPGDMVVLYCESSDPDGDTVSVNVVSNDTNVLTVSGIDNHYEFLFDGKTKCPSGSVCTKANIWGYSLGTGSISVTATANGVSTTLPPFVFPVVQGSTSNFLGQPKVNTTILSERVKGS